MRLRTRTKSRRALGEKEFSFLAREQKGKTATALGIEQSDGQSEKGLLSAGRAGGRAGELVLPGRRWEMLLLMGHRCVKGGMYSENKQ